MPLSDIILSPPYALCTITTSAFGVAALQEKGVTDFVFGSVAQVYDTCDSVSVGDVLYFDRAKTQRILYGSTIYYLVDVANKSFKEIPPP